MKRPQRQKRRRQKRQPRKRQPRKRRPQKRPRLKRRRLKRRPHQNPRRRRNKFEVLPPHNAILANNFLLMEIRLHDTDVVVLILLKCLWWCSDSIIMDSFSLDR